MRIGAKIQGVDRLKGYLTSLGENAKAPIIWALKDSVIAIQAEAKKSIQEHRSSGAKYGKHTASKPGFPPNTDSGRLVRNIIWDIDTTAMQASVGTNLDYGVSLEFGSTRVAARPWLLPAYRKNKKSILTKLRNALIASFKRK